MRNVVIMVLAAVCFAVFSLSGAQAASKHRHHYAAKPPMPHAERAISLYKN
jgi:uncharacterized membrane protein YeiH